MTGSVGIRQRNNIIKPSPTNTDSSSCKVEEDKPLVYSASEIDVVKSLNEHPLQLVQLTSGKKNPRRKPWNSDSMRASTDLHVISQSSLLSMTSSHQNYRGFLNLAIIVLVVMNLRLVIENLMKYGLLFSIHTNTFEHWDRIYPSLLTVLALMSITPYLSWKIELCALQNPHLMTWKAATLCHITLGLTTFFGPLILIWTTHAAIGAAFVLAFTCVIVTLKQISYAHVNSDLRELGGKVIKFNCGTILAFDPNSDVQSAAADVYQSSLIEYNRKIQRIQQDALRTLAQLSLNQSSGYIFNMNDDFTSTSETSPKLTTTVSYVCRDDVIDYEDLNDSLFNNNVNNNNNKFASISTRKLCLGVTAVFKTVNTHTTIELINLPPAPNNLSYIITKHIPDLGHWYYFLMAPTLVFQLSYPRTQSIRIPFVLRRIFEIVFISFVLIFMVEQYIKPTLFNSLTYFANDNILALVERTLKLCIPNLIMWLLIFYVLFHSYLNLVAELMRFGDRVFYRDWWNSGDLGEYWRLWNRPVHDWLARHVYCVAVRAHISPTIAKILVFFISAVLHEVVISIPCHIVTYHAFLGMFMQVPAIAATQWVHKKSGNPIFGNITFWLTVATIGQPLLILLYGYEYFKANGL